MGIKNTDADGVDVRTMVRRLLQQMTNKCWRCSGPTLYPLPSLCNSAKRK